MRRFFGPRGSVSRVTIESQALKNNMPGDPAERVVDVYVAAGHNGQGLPLLVDLVGFTSSGLSHTNWVGFRENLPERLDRLISEERMPPVAHRNVVTTGAAHSHDVPGVDHLTAFTGEIRHHCFRLTLCPRLVSSHYRCRRGDPVGVMAVADEGRSTVLPDLLHGRETRLWGDQAYRGQRAVIRQHAPKAQDFTNRRYRHRGVVDEVERAKNRTKSKVRARVEHSIGVIKRVFGFAKVRYRGLNKNAHRLHVTCALANLFMARRHLRRCQEA